TRLEKGSTSTGLIVIAELGPNGTRPGVIGPGGGGFGGPGGLPGGPGGGLPGGGGPGGFPGGGGPRGGGFGPNPGGGKGPGMLLQKGGKGPGGVLQKGGKGGKQVFPQPMPVNPANGSDRLVALDRNGQPQWQIENLDYPVDFQLLPGNRVLIAEYYSNRVTERDLTGKILWEASNLPRGPINVQRLPNGNTFIALYGTP